MKSSIRAVMVRTWSTLVGILAMLSLTSQVYANQCVGVFDDTLQSHGTGIFLYDNVTLQTQDAILPSISIRNSATTASCSGEMCQASGAPSTGLALPAFVTSSATLDVNHPLYSPDVLSISDAFEFRAISIGEGSSAAITGGFQFYAMNSLTLGADANIALAPGDYWIEELKLFSNASITAPGGQVRLFVRNLVSVGYHATINADNAADFIVVAWDQVSLYGGNDIAAPLYVQGTFYSSPESHFHYPIAAGDITLDENILVEANAYSSALLQGLCSDFGPLVDTDGDGLADGIDHDRDGDGVINTLDIFPDDSTEWQDSDFDGIGDNADPDTDAPVLSWLTVLPLVNQKQQEISVTAVDTYSGIAALGIRNETTNSDTAMAAEGDTYHATLVLTEGLNDISVTAIDVAGNQVTISQQINVDSTAPVITILSGHETWQSLNQTIEYSVADENSGLKTVDVSVNGVSVPVSLTDTQFNAALEGGENTIVISAVDEADNEQVKTFSIIVEGQCSGLFDNAVQAHGGRVFFYDNVSLLTTDPLLRTKSVRQPAGEFVCGGQECLATGKTSSPLKLPEFVVTDTITDINIPLYASGVTDIQDGYRFRQVTVGEGSSAKFSGTSEIFMIKQLVLGSDAKLELAPGDYWIESLELKSNAEIVGRDGQVRLFVRYPMSIGYHAKINAANLADMIIVTWDRISFYGGNQISAPIYSHAAFYTSPDSQFSYPIAASEVTLDENTQVTFTPVADSLLQGICGDSGALPDYDQDGLADGLDFDLDGDGVINTEDAFPYDETRWDEDGSNTDVIAPELTLLSDTQPVRESTYLVQWTATDASGLRSQQLSLNGQLFVVSTEGESFEWPVTLNEGVNNFVLTAEDTAGNIQQLNFSKILDTTAPNLMLDQSMPVMTAESSVQITGSVADGQSGLASLMLQLAGGAEQSINVLNGQFSLTMSLDDISTLATLTATDNVGLQTTSPISVIRDVTAPILSLQLDGQTLQPGQSVTVTSDSIIVDVLVQDSESGLAELSALLNGQPVTISTDNRQITVTLSDGANALSVTAIDQVGNETSMTVSFSADQNNPVLTWLSDTSATNNPNYVARWSAQDDNGIASQLLTVNGLATEIQPVADVFEAQVLLTEGNNSIQLTATDQSGNSQSLTQTIQLDTLAPVLTLAPLDAITSADSLTVSGTVQDASAITLLINTQAVTVLADGGFSTTVALIAGPNAVTVQASDALGHLTQQTETVTSDQQGPELQVSLPAISNSDVITVSGTVSDLYSGVTQVTVENSSTGILYSATVNEGSFSADVILQPGDNAIVVSASDGLSNQSTVTLQTQWNQAGMQWQWLSHINNMTVTDPEIVLEGLLETDIPRDDLTVTIAGQSAVISDWAVNTYSVKSVSLPLTLGVNTLPVKVTSPVAELSDSIVITRVSDDNTGPSFEPVLIINSPANNSQFNGSEILVAGEVKADTTPVVTINGQVAVLTSSEPYFRFSQAIPVAQDQPDFLITVTATVGNDTVLTQTRTLRIDTAAPVLQIDNNLLAYPNVTAILEDPYVLTGSVSDVNFSSLTLNGNVLTVTPSAQDTFTFSTPVSLTNGVETTLTFRAQDTAGNSTSLAYVVKGERLIDVRWLLPLQNSQLLTYGEAFPLQVVVQSSEQSSTYQYQSRVVALGGSDDVAWQDMAFANGTAVTELTLSGAEGDFQVEARVVDINGNVIAALTPRTLTVSAPVQIPLALTKVQPEAGADAVDTKEQISLFFNQAIDPALLEIQVHETAYGKTWINLDAKGTEFFNAKGHQLIDVQRDYEAVPLDIQLIGNNKTVLVSLGREPAYNATMFVDVNYDGASMLRYQYQTKPLPTLINMTIRDQYNRDVPNLRGELGDQIGVTNNEGLVQFGYADNTTPMPDGQYQLWVNPNQANAKYGETKLTVPVEGGRLNDFGFVPVSFLNPEIGATVLTSGENHLLNTDEVLLDLTQAQVTFPDGATTGNAHLQFNTAGYNYPTHGLAEPSWLYSFQPLGIRLTGTAEIKLKLPKHQNSWEYLPANGTLALAVAVNPANEMIEPIGLAERQGNYAVFLHPENVAVLDHLGVIFLPENFQQTLIDYKNETISFPVLMAKLAGLARQYEPEQMEVTQ